MQRKSKLFPFVTHKNTMPSQVSERAARVSSENAPGAIPSSGGGAGGASGEKKPKKDKDKKVRATFPVRVVLIFSLVHLTMPVVLLFLCSCFLFFLLSCPLLSLPPSLSFSFSPLSASFSLSLLSRLHLQAASFVSRGHLFEAIFEELKNSPTHGSYAIRVCIFFSFFPRFPRFL